jgi:hypothetical protein
MVSDGFREREKALENKFGLDEEMRFKVHSRAAKLFGLWAAGQLGMAKKDAEAYAEKTLENDVENPSIVITKVQKDFQARGIEMTERLLHNQFNAKLQQSTRDILSDKLR